KAGCESIRLFHFLCVPPCPLWLAFFTTGDTEEHRDLKHLERHYAPNSNSPSLTTCSSIHPSNGSESTGRRFCQRLNRNRSLLVAATAAGFRSAPGAELGVASNQINGTLNSKFRSKATFTCSSG